MPWHGKRIQPSTSSISIVGISRQAAAADCGLGSEIVLEAAAVKMMFDTQTQPDFTCGVVSTHAGRSSRKGGG